MFDWGPYRTSMNPRTANAVDQALGPLNFHYRATCGARDFAKQAADYAQGRTTPGAIITNAPPGDSAHEATPGGSMAVDFVVVNADGSEDWSGTSAPWTAAIAAVRASQWLHSGADFPPLAPADDDHIEDYSWAHTVNGVPPFHQRMKAALNQQAA